MSLLISLALIFFLMSLVPRSRAIFYGLCDLVDSLNNLMAVALPSLKKLGTALFLLSESSNHSFLSFSLKPCRDKLQISPLFK